MKEKKVSFSFLVNPSLEIINDNGSFLDFINEEYSATLTDCITSIFEVDLNCSLHNYLSIVEDKKIKEYELINSLPLRFANLIGKFVCYDKIGIFLLSNGDIVVAKNQKILFVKRCGRWLNFSEEIFIASLENKVDDKLAKEIFATVMDVSFSHSGGIIAYLENDQAINSETKIIDDFDLLNKEYVEQDLINYLKTKGASDSVAEKEAKKRKNKKEVLSILLNNKYNMSPMFVDVERKLRSDIAALDGALIINNKGEIIACGTIISGDKGSSGGGRSTAAKTLSDYGFAIKVSTDGYIELFVKRDLKYSIK